GSSGDVFRGTAASGNRAETAGPGPLARILYPQRGRADAAVVDFLLAVALGTVRAGYFAARRYTPARGAAHGGVLGGLWRGDPAGTRGPLSGRGVWRSRGRPGEAQRAGAALWHSGRHLRYRPAVAHQSAHRMAFVPRH